VEVEGSWDNWTSRTPLLRNGKDFTLIKLLPPGVYQVRREGRRGQCICLQVLPPGVYQVRREGRRGQGHLLAGWGGRCTRAGGKAGLALVTCSRTQEWRGWLQAWLLGQLGKADVCHLIAKAASQHPGSCLLAVP
jgi:hypothetical protein